MYIAYLRASSRTTKPTPFLCLENKKIYVHVRVYFFSVLLFRFEDDSFYYVRIVFPIDSYGKIWK